MKESTKKGLFEMCFSTLLHSMEITGTHTKKRKLYKKAKEGLEEVNKQSPNWTRILEITNEIERINLEYSRKTLPNFPKGGVSFE